MTVALMEFGLSKISTPVQPVENRVLQCEIRIRPCLWAVSQAKIRQPRLPGVCPFLQFRCHNPPLADSERARTAHDCQQYLG
jgi:hypothetical protein